MVALSYLFLLYAILQFGICAYILVKPTLLPLPLPLPLEDSVAHSVRHLRIVATFSLFLLALGSGTDSARTFAGSFVDATENNINVFSSKAVSWFCFFTHEVLGGTLMLPGFYLWIAAVYDKKSTFPCYVLTTPTRLITITVFLLIVLVSLGAYGFAQYTLANGLELEYNKSLEIYVFKSKSENPFGLVGVFFSSFVWILVGGVLYKMFAIKWFLAVQAFCFVGQGCGGAVGQDMFGCVSNFFEWVVTLALVLLGEDLSKRIMDSKKELTTTLIN